HDDGQSPGILCHPPAAHACPGGSGAGKPSGRKTRQYSDKGSTMKMAIQLTVLSILLIGMRAFAAGAPAQAAPATAPAKTSTPRTLTVAIIDFDVGSGGKPESGKQIAEALMAMLTGTPNIRFVDRASLEKTLQEQ